MTKQKLQKIIVNLVGGTLAGFFIFYICNLIPFYPQASRILISLGAGLAWLINPILGVSVSLGVLIIPITYTSLTLTIILLMFYLIVAVFETWAVGPYGFLILAATIVIVLHKELYFLLLAIPLFAGFMGPRRGAMLAGLSAFFASVLGILMGKASLGLFAIGTKVSVFIHIKNMPTGELFGSGWLAAQTQQGIINRQLFATIFSTIGDNPVLLVQIAIWALAAGLTGYFISKRLIKKIPAYASGVVIGMVVLIASVELLSKVFPLNDWNMDNLFLSILLPLALVCVASPGLIWVMPIITPAKKASDEEKMDIPQWSETGGFEQSQKEIKTLADARLNSKPQKKEKNPGEVAPTGILLFGPPGTEKSKIARKIAEHAKATLVSVNGKDTNAKYHDVFVSYSTRDKVVADTCVEMLEKNNIRCWYAPRDIPPGSDWGKEVTNAINQSKQILLIFSSNSNSSQRVLDEINYGISQQISILPFRIENASPNDALMLHLSSRHWLNGFDPGWKDYLDELLRLVSYNLEVGVSREDTSQLQPEEDLSHHLQMVFTEAQEHHPAILFFEELSDFVGLAKMAKEPEVSVDLTDTFLACLDQLSINPGVFVVAATEYPNEIEETILEPGRLGKQYYLAPPNRIMCKNILTKYLADSPLSLDVDTNKLASQLDVYMLSDIEAIGEEMGNLAASVKGTKRKPVRMVELEKVVKSRKPTYSTEILEKYEAYALQHGCLGKKAIEKNQKMMVETSS